MIFAVALASLALIIAATEVVAHGLARIPGLGAEPIPRYTVTTGRGVAALGFRG